jgi:hypothetical protein
MRYRIYNHVVSLLMPLLLAKKWECTSKEGLGSDELNRTWIWDAYMLKALVPQNTDGSLDNACKLVLNYTGKVVLVIGILDIEHFEQCVLPGLASL